MTDHSYTLRKLSQERIVASPILRRNYLLEVIAALPFRCTVLDELPQEAILDYLYRHPIVVQKQKLVVEKQTGKKKDFFLVTGNFRSAALIPCLDPGVRIPAMLEAPAIPIDVFLTEVIERELLNLSIMAMQTGGYSRAIASLFQLLGDRAGSASTIFPTKSRLARISGVNRREL